MPRAITNIVVIVVAVNYADKLKYTLANNVPFFRKYIVITSPEDIETQQLCKQYNNVVTCYISSNVYKDGAKFNKSGLIHDVQSQVHVQQPNDWILLLDADIMLPSNFDTLMENQWLDTTALYSLKRKDYDTYDDFINTRNAKDYVINFMGFMQLYFDKSKLYAPISASCRESDWDFCNSFHTHRFLDENAYVTHLGRDNENHFGRVSEKWP